MRRHPWILACVGYLLLGGLLLGQSIRPGRTLVPADVLAAHPPYAGTFDGRIHNGLVSDATFQFHPWMVFLDDALDSGRLPQWNPHVLGGVPVTPNGYVSTYYPPFWLVRLTNVFTAYNLFVYLHLVLAAIGVYALSRVLGARAVCAWVAGAAGLGALFWVHWSLHLVHLVGMAWLPMVLAAAHTLIRAPAPATLAAFAASFGLWWLGANPQYAYFGTLALAVYAACLVLLVLVRQGAARAGRASLALAVGLVLGAMLASPVLWPTATIGDTILREREPVEAMSATHLPLVDLVQAVVPEARGSAPGNRVFRPHPYGLALDTPFVGVAALILALAALGRKGGPERWLLLAVALAALVLAFTGPPHRLLHGLVPGYDRFRASSRWLAVLPAFLLPLAALGLERLITRDRDARRLALVGSAAAIGVVVVYSLYVLNAAPDAELPVSFFLPRILVAVVPAAALVAGIVLSRSVPRAVLWCALGAVTLELSFQVPRWFPALPTGRAFPEVSLTDVARQRGGRLLRVGPAREPLPSFAPDLPMAYGLDDAQGQAVLFPRTADRYLRLVDDYGDFAVGTNTAPPLLDPRQLASPLLDALDVRTVLAPSAVPIPPDYPLVDSGEPRVYARRSPGAAVMVEQAVPATREEVWERVADPRWDPVVTSAVVGLPSPVSGEGGAARRIGADPDVERWQVRSRNGGFLRVSGAWDKGWTARIDGREAPVLQADGLFRGTVVPPGEHLVEFRYRNQAEEQGRVGAAAAIGMLALVNLAWPLRRPLMARAGRGSRRRNGGDGDSRDNPGQ